MWGVDRLLLLTRRMVLVAALALGAAGCAEGPEYLPVPTFPGPDIAATGSTTADAGIPDDCERIMPVAELVALLGLPLDSVAVRTTIGVPEPSVGRVERIACRYTGTLGRIKGATLLELSTGRYVDDAAAARQWRLNSEVEDGARRSVPFGSASAVLVERPAEVLLTVVNRDVTLTMTSPAGAPRPPGRSASDTVVDLALRILATITPAETPDRGSARAG